MQLHLLLHRKKEGPRWEIPQPLISPTYWKQMETRSYTCLYSLFSKANFSSCFMNLIFSNLRVHIIYHLSLISTEFLTCPSFLSGSQTWFQIGITGELKKYLLLGFTSKNCVIGVRCGLGIRIFKSSSGDFDHNPDSKSLFYWFTFPKHRAFTIIPIIKKKTSKSVTI